jgi:hypothetical protein
MIPMFVQIPFHISGLPMGQGQYALIIVTLGFVQKLHNIKRIGQHDVSLAGSSNRLPFQNAKGPPPVSAIVLPGSLIS